MSYEAQARPDTDAADNPTRGRWGLVAAALLLQFSLGAVYAWSIFGKALQAAPAFKLSKLESTLPFEVAIGMIFIGTFVGGRIQAEGAPDSSPWQVASSTASA